MEPTVSFYGTKGPYACFSNFYPATFTDAKCNTYHYSEQYFMKKKQEIFDPDNTELAAKIMASRNPVAIKMMGRKVRNFDGKVWDNHKYEVMMSALLLKFSQNPDFLKILLDTQGLYIREASPRDKIWGSGKDGRGQNLLGFALMEVRDILSAISF